jgi:hypothetical protein
MTDHTRINERALTEAGFRKCRHKDTRRDHFLLMKNPYKLDAELLELNSRELNLLMIAVAVCSPSGGGSAMATLFRKLQEIHTHPMMDDRVWEHQKAVHEEVEKFFLEEVNTDAQD